ncbi:MAG: hypothetical protein B6229_01905 [Spirochaetaceae bacterium 4572_7]|nr:MAG: hypothetical protein B6229_01905 [Spirochaetaceae bacterium 4572_7]
MIKSIRNLLLFLLVIVGLYVMHSLSSIMLPLVIAVMFVLIYEPIFSLLHKKKIPAWLITPVLAVGTIFLLIFIVQIFANTTQTIIGERKILGALLYNKVLGLIDYFNNVLPINIDSSIITDAIDSILSTSNISSFAGNGFSLLSSFGSSFFMFSLYFLILLFSMSGYDKYIKYIAGDDDKFLINAKHIQKSIVSYMTVKFIVSLITGSIALIVCILFGVKYAIFWGFITFLLNFIPTIGSLIATTLPTLMAFIQFDSMFKVFLILIILFGVQMTIGNIIEPKIMGNRLRLNTVTIIFGLVFWAFIWGIAGAFLSVPLLVILKIFLQNNESLEFIGRIMGIPEK